MRVVGIIAEYNPLHNGHIYHLEQARALSGAEYCVVVMSGSFVQRGEPACADKYTRTEWALRAGADLVLELPSVFAVAPAERFAIGGVRTLFGTGVVTDLAFGCEETDLSTLYQLSDIISTEPPQYRNALRAHLGMGKPYPRARLEALSDYGVPSQMLDAIVKPNNILAIEYLNALRAFAPQIEPLPVTRIGTDYHSEEIAGEYASATAIRKAIAENRREVLSAMPSFVGGPMLFDEQFTIAPAMLSDQILYALRRLSLDELRCIPDVSEGLENVIFRAVRTVKTADELFEAVKSKRYTLARCKRIAICALLGITIEQVHATMSAQKCSYLRVLGLQKSARPLLGEIARKRSLPLILRNSDIDESDALTQRNIETDMLGTDTLIYASKTERKRDLSGALVL